MFKKKIVQCLNKDNNEKIELPYDYLIYSAGIETVKPEFTYPSTPLISSIYSPEDSKYFRQAVQKGKIEKAVVIGGGYEGCGMIETLITLWGIEVTLIEKEKFLLNSFLDPEISSFVKSCIPQNKVKLLLSTSVDKIELNENSKLVLSLDNGQKIVTDFVFYCLGVKPNTKLAEKSNIKIGKSCGIIVDEQMRTNIPNIWAAGDCVEIKNLISNKPDNFLFGALSNKMARVAADSIAGRNAVFKGSTGALGLTLFNNTICSIGLSEKKAGEFGFETGTVIGSMPDRAEYHPEVKPLIGKLIYEKPGLKLLGLQLAGEGEIKRYLDTFSVLLSLGKTVNDLINLEQGYEFIHSSSISPLNFLGAMAINQEEDGIKNAGPIQASSFKGTFVDLREDAELSIAPFPEKSVHISSSDIRTKVNNFNHDNELMFVCGKGPRGYEAARLFKNNGYKNVSYLGAGSFLYNRIKKMLSP